MQPSEIESLNNLFQDAAKAAEEKLQKEEQKKETPSSDKNKAQTNKSRVEETLGANFKAPKYEIIYKQSVEASEVYGGFGQVTPSTMDSQFLIIRIYLPNEDMKNVDVELTGQTLTLFSKYHRLHLELPHEIDEKTAKASAKAKGILEITVSRKDLM